jgi:hypothetical protein
MSGKGLRRLLALHGLLLLSGGAVSGGAVKMASAQTAAEAVQDKGAHGKQERFREFLETVNEYDKLRNAMRNGVPGADKKATAEQIQMHQEMLAQKIQDARKDAKQGDVFTLDSQKAFRHAIDRAYSGKRAKEIERTLAQGEPVRLDLYINKPYPEKIPTTTVPPTLLQHFPKLPRKIEYRIVGNDLVLEDTESHLVIDIFSGAFPIAPAHT